MRQRKRNQGEKVRFMINFIVGEDNMSFKNSIERIITKYMMKNELDYQINSFSDYNDDFIELVNKRLAFKIYILDIEMPTMSGIDIARIIRNKDIDSVIIFLTGHQELGYTILKDDFLFLSFINKYDNYEYRLEKSLDKALKILKAKKTIKFKDGGVLYTIPLDDILYVVKDGIDRKSVLITDYAEFRLNKSLSEISKMLTENFVKTHRSCIVNKKRIVAYNRSKRLVMLDNGEKLDIVSTRFEGEFI